MAEEQNKTWLGPKKTQLKKRQLEKIQKKKHKTQLEKTQNMAEKKP